MKLKIAPLLAALLLSASSSQAAQPAGYIWEAAAGNLIFDDGGMSTEYLIGSFVDSVAVSADGQTLTIWFKKDDDTIETLTFSGGGSGGGGLASPPRAITASAGRYTLQTGEQAIVVEAVKAGYHYSRLILRTELSATAQNFVFDTGNPSATRSAADLWVSASINSAAGVALTLNSITGGGFTISAVYGITFGGPQGVQGPKGDKGDQGDVGPQGPAGAQGPQGAQGAQGPQGDRGPAGAAGAQGAQGDRGPAGADGSDGSDGAVGPQGPKGDKGDQGDQGPQGIQGPQGPAGPGGGGAGTDQTARDAAAVAQATANTNTGNISALGAQNNNLQAQISRKTADINIVSDGLGYTIADAADAGIAIFGAGTTIGDGLLGGTRDLMAADIASYSWLQSVTIGATQQAVIVRVEGTLGPVEFALQAGTTHHELHEYRKVLSDATWDYYYLGGFASTSLQIDRRAEITHTRFEGELNQGRIADQIRTLGHNGPQGILALDPLNRSDYYLGFIGNDLRRIEPVEKYHRGISILWPNGLAIPITSLTARGLQNILNPPAAVSGITGNQEIASKVRIQLDGYVPGFQHAWLRQISLQGQIVRRTGALTRQEHVDQGRFRYVLPLSNIVADDLVDNIAPENTIFRIAIRYQVPGEASERIYEEAVPFDTGDSSTPPAFILPASIIGGVGLGQAAVDARFTDERILNLAKETRTTADRGRVLATASTNEDSIILIDAPTGSGGGSSTPLATGAPEVVKAASAVGTAAAAARADHTHGLNLTAGRGLEFGAGNSLQLSSGGRLELIEQAHLLGLELEPSSVLSSISALTRTFTLHIDYPAAFGTGAVDIWYEIFISNTKVSGNTRIRWSSTAGNISIPVAVLQARNIFRERASAGFAEIHLDLFSQESGGARFARRDLVLSLVDRELPEFPAEGSRDNRIAKFNVNELLWEEDSIPDAPANHLTEARTYLLNVPRGSGAATWAQGTGGGTGAPLSGATPQPIKSAGAAGVGAASSRDDHVHPLKLATNSGLELIAGDSLRATGSGPALSSAAPHDITHTRAVGTATTAARGDHAHRLQVHDSYFQIAGGIGLTISNSFNTTLAGYDKAARLATRYPPSPDDLNLHPENFPLIEVFTKVAHDATKVTNADIQPGEIIFADASDLEAFQVVLRLGATSTSTFTDEDIAQHQFRAGRRVFITTEDLGNTSITRVPATSWNGVIISAERATNGAYILNFDPTTLSRINLTGGRVKILVESGIHAFVRPRVVLPWSTTRAYAAVVLPTDYRNWSEVTIVLIDQDSKHQTYVFPTSALGANISGWGENAHDRISWTASTRTWSKSSGGTSNFKFIYVSLRP